MDIISIEPSMSLTASTPRAAVLPVEFIRCTLFSPSVKGLYLILCTYVGEMVEERAIAKMSQIPMRTFRDCLDTLRSAQLVTTHKIKGTVVWRIHPYKPGVTVPPDTDGEELVLSAPPEKKEKRYRQESAAELCEGPLCDPEDYPLRHFKQVYARKFLAVPEWGNGGPGMAAGQLRHLVNRQGGEAFSEALQRFVSDDKNADYGGYSWQRFIRNFERYRTVRKRTDSGGYTEAPKGWE